MPFEVGDRVSILAKHDGASLVGKTGTIIKANEERWVGENNILVEVDDWGGGHDGEGMRSGERSCWWFPMAKLELLAGTDNPYYRIERKIKQMRERREAMGYRF